MILTKPQELELFAQLNANNPRLKDWLEQERVGVIQILAKNRDPVSLHQNQGALQLLDRMLATLLNANTHLRGL